MAGGYVAPSGDGLAVWAESLRALSERLSELELPTGTSVNSLVAQVQEAIADIGTTVEAWLDANAYTSAEIDAKVASPGAIAPTTVTASGSVTSGGNVSIGGQLNCLDAYGFDITYTRRTAWWGNDGRAGYASSSRTKKTNIIPAEFDVAALLSVQDYSFFYRAEIARRTQMRIDGTDLDYRPKREFGLMAQDLDAAGFGAFVYHDAEGNPEGIEYSMLTVPLLATARVHDTQITELRADVTALAATVAALAKQMESFNG